MISDRKLQPYQKQFLVGQSARRGGVEYQAALETLECRPGQKPRDVVLAGWDAEDARRFKWLCFRIAQEMGRDCPDFVEVD